MRILIADDNQHVTRALARVIRGHDITIVHNVPDALEALDADPTFDLIISDVEMGPWNGDEIHRHLLEHHPALAPKLVFFTGGVRDPDVRAYLEACGAEVILKDDLARIRELVTR